MARYRPKQTLEIAEPCHEDWNGMSGNARVRHCAHCDREVHNTAALTPTQIEQLMTAPGRLPCMRIARFPDGSLLVAEEARSQPCGGLAGAAMAALVSISTAVASAQSTNRAQVTQGAPPPVAQAIYSGHVVATDGKAIPHAHVYLTRMLQGKEQRVEAESDANGGFRLNAVPGEWSLGAYGPMTGLGAFRAQQQPVTLHSGEQDAAKPVRLEYLEVTAGLIAPPRSPATPRKHP